MAKAATLGKNEYRKAHSPKEHGRKGKFHPDSSYWQISESSSRKKYLLPSATDSYEEYKCHQSLPEIQKNFPYGSQSVKTCQ